MNANPSPGQQGGRADHDPGEVARRDGQGGQHQPGRCGELRRAGDARRASCSWIRPATTRSRPPARWPAAPTSSASPPAAAACSAASRRPRSSSPPTRRMYQPHGRRHGRQLRHRPRRRRDRAAVRPTIFDLMLRVASGERPRANSSTSAPPNSHPGYSAPRCSGTTLPTVRRRPPAMSPSHAAPCWRVTPHYPAHGSAGSP